MSSVAADQFQNLLGETRGSNRADDPAPFKAHGKVTGIHWSLTVENGEIVIRNWQKRLVSFLRREEPFDHEDRFPYDNPELLDALKNPPSQMWDSVRLPELTLQIGRWLQGYTGGWENIIKVFPRGAEYYLFASPTEQWDEFIASLLT